MKKMIEINGLYKSYTDEEEVVKDIHMKVEKGTIHGLIGHNGSGKTTIIKCVTGIYPPDRGEVLLGGEPVYENVKSKRKRLVMWLTATRCFLIIKCSSW